MAVEKKPKNDRMDLKGLDGLNLDDLENLGSTDSPTSSKKDAKDTRQAQVEAQNNATSEKFDPGLKPATINKARKVGTKSWKPAALTHVSDKDPNFTYRHANKDKPGRINKLLAEGWEIVTKDKDSAIANIRSISDGTALDSAVRTRELVLMRIPKEVAQQRAAYYKEKQFTTKKLKESFAGNTGGNSYGDIKVN